MTLSPEYLTDILPGVLGQLQKQNLAKQYFENPELWAKHHLGAQMWEAQADIAHSMVVNKNTAVKAGHEVGKSWLAGVLICWWVDTRWELPGGCFVVSTAPSNKQINAIVWREVRRFHAESRRRHAEYLRRKRENLPLGEYAYNDHPLPGYITADAHWRLEDGIELGYGAKPPDSKDDTMSGIHARYVLALGDEAVGLSEALIGDLGNITSNATSRRFIIMNPTNPLSYAGKIFKDNNGTWSLHTISVLDSPNFHGGGLCECEHHDGQPKGLGLPIEVLETLVDQTYVDDMLRDWGEDHPTYISRVLGEFAWDAGPTLISPQEMAVALDCEVDADDAQPILGVDVSRSDRGDMNTVYEYRVGMVRDTGLTGGKVRFVDAWNDKNSMRTVARINDLALERSASVVQIDGSGLGGPMADRLREISEGRYIVFDMLGGKPAPEAERDRFFNARAWWYAELRRRIAGNQLDIDLNDDKLQEELLAIETRFPSQGVQKLMIESKQEMRKRGIFSPDYADAANYACASLDGMFGKAPATTRQFMDEDMDFTPETQWGGFNFVSMFD